MNERVANATRTSIAGAIFLMVFFIFIDFVDDYKTPIIILGAKIPKKSHPNRKDVGFDDEQP